MCCHDNELITRLYRLRPHNIRTQFEIIEENIENMTDKFKTLIIRIVTRCCFCFVVISHRYRNLDISYFLISNIDLVGLHIFIWKWNCLLIMLIWHLSVHFADVYWRKYFSLDIMNKALNNLWILCNIWVKKNGLPSTC